MPFRTRHARITRFRWLAHVAICAFLSLYPTAGRADDLADLEEVIDESRLTFARFTGHPDMAWFRERARTATAIFIAPQITRASYIFGASWGTGVLLVRNPSTGRWSQPAFYRVAGASFGLQVGALHSEIVALATNRQTAAEMVDGAFTLGIGGTLGAGKMGGGVSRSLDVSTGTGIITVAAPTGLFIGLAVGGTLVLAGSGANELYYGQPVDLDDLRDSRVQQWYSDRLLNTITELSRQHEPEPKP